MFKKKGVQRLIAGLAITSVMASSVIAFAGTPQKQISVTYNNIKVNLNNRQLSMKDAAGKNVECFNYSGTVYAPLRAISQALGLTVAYDSTTSKITLTGNTSGTSKIGAPPSGSPQDGTRPTPPAGDSQNGKGFGGNPPSGNPPDGTPPAPPLGDLQNGIAPSATPSADTQASANTVTQKVTKAINVSNQSIKVILNGKEVALKDANGKTVEPINFNGTIYLPVRAISQALGLNVSYDAKSSIVKLISGNDSGKQPGSNEAGTSNSAVSGTAVYT